MHLEVSSRAFNEVVGDYLGAPEIHRRYPPEGNIPFHFQEIDPSQTRVSLLSREALADQDFRLEMCYMVAWVDRQINADISGNRELFEGEEAVFGTLFSSEEVREHQKAYLSRLRSIAGSVEDESPIFACPMNGGLAILDQLRLGTPPDIDGVSTDRLFPAWIEGSLGTQTGLATVTRKLAPQLKDSSKKVVVADDIADSCVTPIQLARARRIAWIGNQKDDYSLLIKDIQRLRNDGKRYDDPELMQLYENAARLFYEEGVILAPLYIKNEAMRNALLDLCGDLSDDSWAEMQRQVMEEVPILDEDHWVLGGQEKWNYPLLDVGFDNAEILQLRDSAGELIIPKEYHQDLINWGFLNTKLRFGAGVKELIYLKNKSAFKKAVAGLMTLYMDYVFADVEDEIE